MAMVAGTVTNIEPVERSRIQADSASIALHLAANKTTVVAMGKLQQTRASRANKTVHLRKTIYFGSGELAKDSQVPNDKEGDSLKSFIIVYSLSDSC